MRAILVIIKVIGTMSNTLFTEFFIVYQAKICCTLIIEKKNDDYKKYFRSTLRFR